MIGKICVSITPFYDTIRNKKSFKKRPVLIIAGPRSNDYTVLPISTITRKENLDKKYDLEVNPSIYPMKKLTKLSYVRTHKQTTIHESEIVSTISDLRGEYEDLYLEVLTKLSEFNHEIEEHAI